MGELVQRHGGPLGCGGSATVRELWVVIHTTAEDLLEIG